MKDKPWIWFLAIAGIAVIASFCKSYDTFGTVLAELLIAFVIYYELEENRLMAFLQEAMGKAYEDRGCIYAAHAQMDGKTRIERAEAFRKYLREHPDLRTKCDYQLSHFSRLSYIVRRSLIHRNLGAEWFPEVAVRLWAMLSGYIDEVDGRGIRTSSELMEVVVASVDKMKKNGKTFIAIQDQTGVSKIEITSADFDAIRAEVNGRLERLRRTGG